MIQLGIIGLGEVSQLMHLPILQDLGEKYDVVAISDISPSLLDFVQKKYKISKAYLDADELIDDPAIQAVLLLSPDQYHGRQMERALRNGKHVFVEKPATLSRGELETLIEVKKNYPDQIVMVGYMRRYASPFLKAKEILEAQPRPTQHLRFRDIICEGPFYIGQTRPIFYPNDAPAASIEEGGRLRREQLDASIGADASDAQRTAYQMMTGLGCHSFSAIRELFGLPQRILSVATSHQGRHLVIVMEYDGFLATYELVNDQDIVEFDACIEIYQQNRKIKIKYETPYIRYQPMYVEVTESSAETTQYTHYGPDYCDPFQTELLLFAESIATGNEPKTGLSDAIHDLTFFEKVVSMIGKEERSCAT